MKWKFVTFLAATLIVAQGFCGCFDGCFRADLLAMEEPMEIPPMPEEGYPIEDFQNSNEELSLQEN